jgi:hypothetical protein
MLARLVEIVYILGWFSGVFLLYKPMVWQKSATFVEAITSTPLFLLKMLGWVWYIPLHYASKGKS